MSQEQIARQRTRKRGRYSKMNSCEGCGKALGSGYYSDPRVDRMKGYGLVLCKKCALEVSEVPDEDYIDFFKRAKITLKKKEDS